MAGNGFLFTCERIGHAVIHMKKYTAALDILLFSCEKPGLVYNLSMFSLRGGCYYLPVKKSITYMTSPVQG
jgi:hypothetical protein